MDAARTTVIEGQRVLVVERKPPIPPTLELLLEGGRGADGRYWTPMRVGYRQPLTLKGARPECGRQEHRTSIWLEGFSTGSDGVARLLSLHACADCGAVCVRDRSVDSLDRLPTGRRPLLRRDHVIGWYTGARPRQRVYT